MSLIGRILSHDERSEECPKGVSAIKCLINEMSYSIFYTLPLFQWKKKIQNLKPLKLKDSTQGHVCGLPRHHSIRQN
jgi:hypothetical protein